jgi:hypothetical protein
MEEQGEIRTGRLDDRLSDGLDGERHRHGRGDRRRMAGMLAEGVTAVRRPLVPRRDAREHGGAMPPAFHPRVTGGGTPGLPPVPGTARVRPRQEAEAEGGEEEQADERSLLHAFRDRRRRRLLVSRYHNLWDETGIPDKPPAGPGTRFGWLYGYTQQSTLILPLPACKPVNDPSRSGCLDHAWPSPRLRNSAMSRPPPWQQLASRPSMTTAGRLLMP